MSHKECSCNDCEKPGDDKLLKQPIRLMEPPVEAFLFTPEEELDDADQIVADLDVEDEHEAIEAGVRSAIPQFEGRAWTHGTLIYQTKDSGQRQEFSTGMVRDVQTNKPRYDLLDRAMLKRWAELMGRGAIKYGEENWRKAETEEELKRFKASAIRHLFQWLDGETDEDHASAIYFNVAGAEMVKAKLGGIGK